MVGDLSTRYRLPACACSSAYTSATDIPDASIAAMRARASVGVRFSSAAIVSTSPAPYVLVVMVRGHPAEDQGEAMMAELSQLVWELNGLSR